MSVKISLSKDSLNASSCDMNPLVDVCLSFGFCVIREQVITVLGRLRNMGYIIMESVDSAEPAETRLGQNDRVAEMVNALLKRATDEGRGGQG